MKNIVSTVLVFGFVVILIIGGAYLFQAINGVDSINNIDNKLMTDIGKALEPVDNLSNKPVVVDDVEKVKDNDESVEKSISDFVGDINVKENLKKGIGNLFAQLGYENGSVEKLQKNEKTKDFFTSEGLQLDEELLNTLLNDPNLQKLFKSEGKTLNKKTIEEVLNTKEVKEFFKTGVLNVDDETLGKLLDNETIQEIIKSNKK